MVNGLVAGFGDPLGHDLLAQLYQFGFRIIRQDVQRRTIEQIAVLSTELSEADLQPLWIAGDIDVLTSLPDDSLVEWGNEPDLEHPDVHEYASSLAYAYARTDGRLRLSPGAISNLNDRGFRYLRQIIDVVPLDMPVAVHRYPNWPGPDEPHDGYGSRIDEIDALRRITGERAIWVTEVGYHSMPQRTGRWPWSPRKAWTDEQVAAFALRERAIWQDYAQLLCWYQLASGPSDSYLDHFGLRTIDGAWKPVAGTFSQDA